MTSRKLYIFIYKVRILSEGDISTEIAIQSGKRAHGPQAYNIVTNLVLNLYCIKNTNTFALKHLIGTILMEISYENDEFYFSQKREKKIILSINRTFLNVCLRAVILTI